MKIKFTFEDKPYEAKLLKMSLPYAAHYHIFLKDKELIEKFCLSFLFVHDKEKRFYNIGVNLYPHFTPILESLIVAVQDHAFTHNEESINDSQKEMWKQYDMFYNKRADE